MIQSRYVEIKLIENRKGVSIKFSKVGFMFAVLTRPRLKVLKRQINDTKAYFIAIHKLMFGIGFNFKN